MSRQIIVRPEAFADAMEASHWYDERVAGLGKRFLSEVDAIMSVICDSPHQFPTYHADVRRAQ